MIKKTFSFALKGAIPVAVGILAVTILISWFQQLAAQKEAAS